jgi:methanethiol S-methyltransferase
MESIFNFSAYDILLTLGLLWALFGLCHSALATDNVKAKLQSALPFLRNRYRIFYNLFSLAFLSAFLVYSILLPSQLLFEPSSLTELFGLMFTLYGILIIRISLKSYGFNHFVGLDNEIDLQAKSIKLTGLLRYVRHPIYTGLILFFVGLFFYFPNVASAYNLLFVTLYILIGIRLEEQKLIKEFGNDYLEYRKKVPMLIPNLK